MDVMCRKNWRYSISITLLALICVQGSAADKKVGDSEEKVAKLTEEFLLIFNKFTEVSGKEIVFRSDARLHFYTSEIPFSILEELIDSVNSRKKDIAHLKVRSISWSNFTSIEFEQALSFFSMKHHLYYKENEEEIIFELEGNQFSVYSFNNDKVKQMKKDPRFESIFKYSVIGTWSCSDLSYLLTSGSGVGRFEEDGKNEN